jgi:hypothetical protein
MDSTMNLYTCSRGHISSECDAHDVVELVHSVDRPAIYQAFIERSCVDCGEFVTEQIACEMCCESPAAQGSDRCDHCDIQVATEEAAEELAAKKRAAELRKTLISIALTYRGAA